MAGPEAEIWRNLYEFFWSRTRKMRRYWYSGRLREWSRSSYRCSGRTISRMHCRMLDATSFDAILLDLNLPDSSGIQTFHKIRQHRGESALMVWTSLEDEDMALEAVREGADDYLTKGDLAGAALARHIRLVVERRKLRAPSSATATAEPARRPSGRRRFWASSELRAAWERRR